jgi:hypothetical protein
MRKYTENEHRYTLRKANKIRAINKLGGRCKICGEKNIHMIEFHHESENKENNISQILDNRWSSFEKEISKCILLCSNCHAEFHCNISKNNHNRRQFNRKIEILKKIGIFKCDQCGYSGKNFASLDFHHIDKNKKKFKIADATNVTIGEIIDETKKCKVICKNCHKMEHFDIDRFNSLKLLIKYKIDNPKEKTKPVDTNTVWKMYRKHGRSQTYISEHLGVGNGTISHILKRIRERLHSGIIREDKNGFLRSV